jgi:hypothetical protein
MKPQEWYIEFIKRFSKSRKFEKIKPVGKTREEWTSTITSLIHEMGGEKGFYCCCRSDGNGEKELLTIDFLWFSKKAYNKIKCEYYLPSACIEHETYASKSTNLKNVKDCFWKILCIRSELKLLIAYFTTDDERKELISELNNVLCRSDLSKNKPSVLLLLGNGNEINRDKKYAAWVWNGKSLVRKQWLHP